MILVAFADVVDDRVALFLGLQRIVANFNMPLSFSSVAKAQPNEFQATHKNVLRQSFRCYVLLLCRAHFTLRTEVYVGSP